MRELVALSNEAGELLWEMVAEGDQGDATGEMKEKAQQLQVPPPPPPRAARALSTCAYDF